MAQFLLRMILAVRLLEHWAYLLLRLAACPGMAGEAAKQLHGMAQTLESLMEPIKEQGPDWARTILLSSPTLTYLLASHAVGVCAELDGGPTYGMARRPEAGVAPTYDSSGQLLPQEGAEGTVCTQFAQFALYMWRQTIRAGREEALEGVAARQVEPEGSRVVPPLNVDATYKVCMRLVEQAARAMAEGSEAPPEAAGGQAAAGPSRVATVDAPSVAVLGLSCAREALGDTLTFDAAVLGSAVSRKVQRWWRLLAAVVAALERLPVAAGGGGQCGILEADMLVQPPVASAFPGLPPAPSPCVAAALDAGILSLLCRGLRRRVGQARPLRKLLQPRAGAEYAWDQVLAFGQPQEAAALVDAAASLLQGALEAAHQAPAAAGQGDGSSSSSNAAQVPPADGKGSDKKALDNLKAALRIATGMCRPAVHLAGLTQSAATAAAQAIPDTFQPAAPAPPLAAEKEPGTAVPAAGMPRLGLLLSYAAAHLLPAVSRALLGPHAAALERSPLYPGMLADLLVAAVLVAAAGKRARDREAAAQAAPVEGVQEGEAAGSGSGGVISANRTLAGEAAEWQRLLMEDGLNLTALLGKALGLREPSDVLKARLDWAQPLLLRLAPAEAAGVLQASGEGSALAGALEDEGGELEACAYLVPPSRLHIVTR